MDFQTAPYEGLCGCVSIITNREMPPNIVEHLIRNMTGQRNVCANCEICGGSGILPEATE